MPVLQLMTRRGVGQPHRGGGCGGRGAGFRPPPRSLSMAAMTRGTRGTYTGCGAVLAMALAAGCAQSGQGSQQSTRQPQPAQASVVESAAAAAGSVVNAATGAATGAVNGAVAGATAGATPAPKRPRIKRNARGGYDASELQQDVLKRAHAARDRYGVVDRTKPTPRPATQSANR